MNPIMRRKVEFLSAASLSLAAFCWTVHAEQDTPDPLSLQAAVALALERSPRLAAMGEGIAAAEGRTDQAGRRPNPELSLGVEQVRFGEGPRSETQTRATDGTPLDRSVESGATSGFGESEFTLSVSQLIELGGKRAKRIAMAEGGRQVAQWELEITRASVIAETRRAFIEALVAQEAFAVHERLVTLAGQATDAAILRVDAGKDAPIARDRAEVTAALARIQLAAIEKRLIAARYVLAAQWADREPSFSSVSGDLYAIETVPSVEILYAALENSAALSRWTAEVARRDAAVRFERASALPDLSVSIGWKAIGQGSRDSALFDAGGTASGFVRTRPEDAWEHSLVAGVSIPLPFFNRNQGSIREAEHLTLQAAHERRAALSESWVRVAAVHGELTALAVQIDQLQSAVLPGASRAREAAQLGFEQGKFSYLDALDAQRTLFEVQNEYINALAGYHLGIVELERLLGAPLKSVSANSAGDQ